MGKSPNQHSISDHRKFLTAQPNPSSYFPSPTGAISRESQPSVEINRKKRKTSAVSAEVVHAPSGPELQAFQGSQTHHEAQSNAREEQADKRQAGAPSSSAPVWTELKTKAGKERKRLPLACIACRR
jgi:hypothetical protein